MKKTQIIIRVSEDEKKAFETSANLSGVSLSAWIRERLRMISVGELESAGLVAPFIDELVKEFRNGKKPI